MRALLGGWNSWLAEGGAVEPMNAPAATTPTAVTTPTPNAAPTPKAKPRPAATRTRRAKRAAATK